MLTCTRNAFARLSCGTKKMRKENIATFPLTCMWWLCVLHFCYIIVLTEWYHSWPAVPTLPGVILTRYGRFTGAMEETRK